MKKWSHYLILSVILLFGGITFFFRLGQSSLGSWDEAWYGSIATNILHSADAFRMTFNGAPYYDHPPLGFWLISTTMTLFGHNEFGVRAASAVFGLFTLIIVYFLGKHLFHSSVGLASALALVSSPWFTLRARSGNLDIFLTFFFVLTFYLALISSQRKQIFPLFLISLCLLFFIKSATPFTIFPVLFYIFRHRLRYFFISLFTPLTILLVWLLVQPSATISPLQKYFLIGLPGVKVQTDFFANFSLIKSYLHYGVGVLFRPAIISLPLGLLFSTAFIPLLIFLISFLFPFFFSAKGQIWHLIPAFPFLILYFTGTMYLLFSKILRFRSAPLITLMLTLLLVVPQLDRNWREFIDIPAFISDEAILSREATKYPDPLIIDEDFTPAAAYYSQKIIIRESSRSLLDIFAGYPSFVLITHDWRLDKDSVPQNSYQLLKTDRDRVLIRKILSPPIP